jgi:hypothetical protein
MMPIPEPRKAKLGFMSLDLIGAKKPRWRWILWANGHVLASSGYCFSRRRDALRGFHRAEEKLFHGDWELAG